ncbi:hypothetical protein ILUMI_10722 [Ignelater luminosus]|uniref:Uncharacterized protein n=1 Tax=Ignelater luminosus TaxID=2038154 RepID=A0A8K0D6H0_IGNLU|nr:hypothetical protein ILUMI_10722 [Ignelater luminosus]
MWEYTNQLLQEETGSIRSASQCENRYKTILKRKKITIENNGKTGEVRQNIEFESELRLMSTNDDNEQPEVMWSRNAVTICKSSKEKKARKSKLAEVLSQIHKENEEKKEQQMFTQRKLLMKRRNFQMKAEWKDSPVAHTSICRNLVKSLKNKQPSVEPMIPSILPTRPWEKLEHT